MRVYLRAVRYFRQDSGLICLWLALIGLSTGVGLLMAWPMAVLVDCVLSTASNTNSFERMIMTVLPSSRHGQIMALAGATLALRLLQEALASGQMMISNQIYYRGLMRVRCALYRKLQSLHLAYHRNQPQGDAIYRLSNDTYGCQAVLGVLVNMVVSCGTLGVMTAILMSRSVGLTLLAFSIAPVLMVTNIVYGRRLTQRSLDCRECDARFTTTVQQSITCIGLVQAFGRERKEFGRFRQSIRATVASWWRLNREQVAYNLIIGTTFGIGGAVIFGYGGHLVYANKGMSVGDLLIFTGYLGMLWGPLCTLTGFPAAMQSGMAGAKRVFEVLDRDCGIEDSPRALSLPRRMRRLEMKNVRFGYYNDHPVLRGLNVSIEPGAMVAFVGPSGVGKSTLLNLLPRFYDPQVGVVCLDGRDLRQIKLADVRKHVALVLQESVILPTTIAENIAYGRPDADEASIRRAAELARAAEFIESLPYGYDTQVAEGGQNLSGGQRQRIAIARALLTEAPIIVLDEPTSALDPHHEHLVTQSLRTLKGGRTIVIVSHRLSTVVDCDQIFVMERGIVVEHGTHQQLLEKGGRYSQMAREQLQAGTQGASMQHPSSPQSIGCAA